MLDKTQLPKQIFLFGQAKHNTGFSLIEIMIVVAIIAILAGVAYPSYNKHIEKARRTDGKNALLDAAALQEKFFFQSTEYTNDLNNLGGASSKEGHYTMSVLQPCGSTACYRIVATATGVQANDDTCKILTIDQKNEKKSFSDSVDGTDTTARCW